eukprot:scaffold188542_cov30-Tisochrysis_lutea.AAC.8
MRSTNGAGVPAGSAGRAPFWATTAAASSADQAAKGTCREGGELVCSKQNGALSKRNQRAEVRATAWAHLPSDRRPSQRPQRHARRIPEVSDLGVRGARRRRCNARARSLASVGQRPLPSSARRSGAVAGRAPPPPLSNPGSPCDPRWLLSPQQQRHATTPSRWRPPRRNQYVDAA